MRVQARGLGRVNALSPAGLNLARKSFMSKYFPPSINETGFNCPVCGVYAQQHWQKLIISALPNGTTPRLSTVASVTEEHDKHISRLRNNGETKHIPYRQAQTASLIDSLHYHRPLILEPANDPNTKYPLGNAWASACYNCKQLSFWVNDALVDPRSQFEIQMNPDLPAECELSFKEAADCLPFSPRAACALLRLCLQQLLDHLEVPGNSIDKQIAHLVAEKRLSAKIIDAMDVVRVTGNNAVHPSKMDNIDNAETATSLFAIINLVAERTISQIKHIEEMYKKLPTGAKNAIAKRDGKAAVMAKDSNTKKATTEEN